MKPDLEILKARIEYLEGLIERFQREPYTVLKHDGKYYKAYELKQLEMKADPSVAPGQFRLETDREVFDSKTGTVRPK